MASEAKQGPQALTEMTVQSPSRLPIVGTTSRRLSNPWNFFLPALSLACASAGAAEPRIKVPVSPLADALQYMGPGARETNYTLWCVAPIMDDAKEVHLFCARWPEPNVDPAWRKSSEIAHYVGDRPEGPFVFSDITVKGSGVEGAWDRYTAHNPEINRFGDTYALLYVANSDYRQPPHPLNQKVGMVISKSLNGPWTKVGRDGLILDNQEGHFSEGRQVVNPTLLKVGEKFHLYYKTATQQGGKWRTVFGLAIADRLEGPYVHQPEPVTAEGVVIEDASAFLWDGKVCLLTTDNHGLVTGLEGALALWVSEDGIHFKPEWTQLGMRLFPDYLPDYDPASVKRVYGGKPKPERPKVLMVDGKPAWLYVASGWIYDGWPRCETHVFKIDLPEGASPLP
jgi:hypothetical protein